MCRNFSTLALLMTVLFVFHLSCEKKTTQSGERTDWDAIKAIIGENPDIFLVDVFDAYKDTTVNPVFFREISSKNFDIKDGTAILPADTSHLFEYAEVPWEDTIRGVFHYFIDGKEYTKSIYAYSVVNAYFERWGDVYDPHRGWLLKKISGNVIASVPSHIIPPVVHITSKGVDTWFSESMVLNTVKKDSVLYFSSGEKITFTVDSEYISDVFLFLHTGEDGNFRKIPFVDNGDGTFSANWTTTSDPNIAKGYKHAFVDAISRDAVTDTTVKYDSKAWGIIYRIK
jgi:hypothetical protein